MGYTTWAVHGHQIKEEKLKELIPHRYKAFTGFLNRVEIAMEEYAKYLQYQDIEELEFGDYSHDNDIKLTASILDKKWVRLYEALYAKTGIKLDLVYPGGEVESGEDKVYFSIDNAMIVNPEIDREFLEDSYFEVITGG